MHIDRRRSPRIELVGQLHVTSAMPEQAIDVREISLGGMAIETVAPFEVGTVHAFRLTLGDESTVELFGKVMHSRPVDPAEGKAAFVTGIQFVDEDPEEGNSPVEDIIKRVR
jgi:hypothetical protein